MFYPVPRYLCFPLVVLVGLLVLVGAGTAKGEAPRMDAYYQWLHENVDAIEADLPKFTQVAEAAAKRYVTGDWKIAAAGEFGVMSEAVGRSGGIMAMQWGYPPKYLDRKEGENYIVLFALREERIEKYAEAAKEALAGEHSFVIAMGPQRLIDQARDAGMPMDETLAVHAAPQGGLFKVGEKHLVPTTPPASMAGLWTWTAEFVAACTRHGKMPVMHQSYAVEGAFERAKERKKRRFERDEHTPEPIEAGKLGQQFLNKLRANLDRVWNNEKQNLQRAVDQAWKIRQQDGELYAFVHSHSLVMQQVDYPNSPGYLTQLNSNWHEQKGDIELTPNDFVFCVGYSSQYTGERFNNWTKKARESGATLAWSFTGYNEDQVKAVQEAGEVLIDQHWAFGDAEVEVPGYKLDICPTSGHIAQAVLRLFNAGMLAREQASKANNPGEQPEASAGGGSEPAGPAAATDKKKDLTRQAWRAGQA